MNGFWAEKVQIEKDLKEQGDLEEWEDVGFEFMENEQTTIRDPKSGRNINAYDFLHGWCDVFAFELAKLRKSRKDTEVMGVYEYGKLVHAFCEIPGGYIDIRGFCDDFDELMQTFYEDGLFENMDETTVRPVDKPLTDDKVYKEAARMLLERYPGYYGI